MAFRSAIRPRSASFACLACLVPLACAVEPSERPDLGPGITGIGGGGNATGDGGADDGGTLGGTDADDDDDDDADGAGDDDDDSGGEIKLDVGAGDGTGDPECVDGQCRDSGCVAVDLLFIIDNSASMQPYQTALAQAFPTFADTIVSALPPGVNIHVGVTSTEMGFSTSGNNTISYLGNEATSCEATGDGGAPAASFYQTPDVAPSNTNGAQGRLYQVGGVPYFDLDTDASAATIDDLQTWFSSAAQIGEFGSQVEMSAAAAAWATDPVNAPRQRWLRARRRCRARVVLRSRRARSDARPRSRRAARQDRECQGGVRRLRLRGRRRLRQ